MAVTFVIDEVHVTRFQRNLYGFPLLTNFSLSSLVAVYSKFYGNHPYLYKLIILKLLAFNSVLVLGADRYPPLKVCGVRMRAN